MHVILGGTGHIGASLAAALLARGEDVTVVTRKARNAAALTARGARAAEVDIHDTAALRKVFSATPGARVFVLNPPANPSSDPEIEERRSVKAILAALADAPVAKVVAQSTYGAQAGSGIGDLGVLHELERGLAARGVPTTVLRGAYFMTNWDHAVEMAKTEGKLFTFFPADFVLPMVAPEDIGRVAAEAMTAAASLGDDRVISVEGPARYSPNDVAAAFGKALGRRVDAVAIPREAWEPTLEKLGFSAAAAKSLAGMTDAALRAAYPRADEVTRGTTTIEQYVAELLRARSP